MEIKSFTPSFSRFFWEIFVKKNLCGPNWVHINRKFEKNFKFSVLTPNLKICLHRSLHFDLKGTEKTSVFSWVIEKRVKNLQENFCNFRTTGGPHFEKKFFYPVFTPKNFKKKFCWPSKWLINPIKPWK